MCAAMSWQQWHAAAIAQPETDPACLQLAAAGYERAYSTLWTQSAPIRLQCSHNAGHAQARRLSGAC
jgi:hypothetical protein